MQNAKDTFYLLLRSRLAAVNAERTTVLRGAVRPAVIVLENELDAEGSAPHEAFLLGWTDHATDLSESLPLDSARCVIRYTTRGTAELSGMDRGRVLDAMDVELTAMLQPGVAPKQNFTGDSPVTMATAIFWSAPEWSAAVGKDGALTRSASVTVFSQREAGE
ncbi:MAG: hypothetical protein ACRYF4_10735 [Janthinobacterium lividum]